MGGIAGVHAGRRPQRTDGVPDQCVDRGGRKLEDFPLDILSCFWERGKKILVRKVEMGWELERKCGAPKGGREERN